MIIIEELRMTPIFLSIETVNGNCSLRWKAEERSRVESKSSVLVGKKMLALRVFIWFRMFGFGLEY